LRGEKATTYSFLSISIGESGKKMPLQGWGRQNSGSVVKDLTVAFQGRFRDKKGTTLR